MTIIPHCEATGKATQHGGHSGATTGYQTICQVSDRLAASVTIPGVSDI